LVSDIPYAVYDRGIEFAEKSAVPVFVYGYNTDGTLPSAVITVPSQVAVSELIPFLCRLLHIEWDPAYNAVLLYRRPLLYDRGTSVRGVTHFTNQDQISLRFEPTIKQQQAEEMINVIVILSMDSYSVSRRAAQLFPRKTTIDVICTFFEKCEFLPPETAFRIWFVDVRDLKPGMDIVDRTIELPDGDEFEIRFDAMIEEKRIIAPDAIILPVCFDETTVHFRDPFYFVLRRTELVSETLQRLGQVLKVDESKLAHCHLIFLNAVNEVRALFTKTVEHEIGPTEIKAVRLTRTRSPLQPPAESEMTEAVPLEEPNAPM
jgi:hypothetical protein